MSRFKEIVLNCLLEAKQVGILYHTTTSSGLASILKSNKIWTNWIQGVSFTRDKNYWYGDYPAQLVLDGDKLSENHKVYPFNYSYACDIEDDVYCRPESETAILGRGRKLDFDLNKRGDYWGTYGDPGDENEDSIQIKNIKKYIIGLRVKPSLCVSQEEFDRIIQTFSKYCPDKSITIVE